MTDGKTTAGAGRAIEEAAKGFDKTHWPTHESHRPEEPEEKAQDCPPDPEEEGPIPV